MSLLPMAEYLGVSSGTNPPTNDAYCISKKKKNNKENRSKLVVCCKTKSQAFFSSPSVQLGLLRVIKSMLQSPSKVEVPSYFLHKKLKLIEAVVQVAVWILTSKVKNWSTHLSSTHKPHHQLREVIYNWWVLSTTLNLYSYQNLKFVKIHFS